MLNRKQSAPFLPYCISTNFGLSNNIRKFLMLMRLLESVASTKFSGLDIQLTNFLNTFINFKTRFQFAVLMDLFEILRENILLSVHLTKGITLNIELDISYHWNFTILGSNLHISPHNSTTTKNWGPLLSPRTMLYMAGKKGRNCKSCPRAPKLLVPYDNRFWRTKIGQKGRIFYFNYFVYIVFGENRIIG